jgi:hypothetical protein
MKVTFLNSRTRAVMIFICLLLAYAVGSWAVNGGSLLVYGLGVLLFITAVLNIVVLVKQQFIHSKTHTSKRP